MKIKNSFKKNNLYKVAINYSILVTIIIIIIYDFKNFYILSKRNSYIFQYTPTFIDLLQINVQIFEKDFFKLIIYLITYCILVFLILKIFTNIYIALLGTVFVSSNELTFNTLLSAPDWDFLPKLFFLLSLLLILIFVPIANHIYLKLKNPIGILFIFGIIMFTIIYPVFFIHYRFYSPILIFLILITIMKLNTDFNLKIFLYLSSILSLLFIKSPEYLESFFISGFLKSSLLSKFGYSNPQHSLSVVNTDENIQTLIDNGYFHFLDFIGIFSSDIFEKVKFTLNFLLTNNLFNNSSASTSIISRNFYGYLFLNPSSVYLFSFLLTVLVAYFFTFLKNKQYLKITNQISGTLLLYFLIIITFSRYQLNSFFHIQFFFIVIWYTVFKFLIEFKFNIYKNVVLFIFIFLISLSIPQIFTNKYIEKYFESKIYQKISHLNFKSFEYTEVKKSRNEVYLKIKEKNEFNNFILKLNVNNKCKSNVVRIKPIYDLKSNESQLKNLKNFETTWIGIENIGLNQSAELVTGVLAPSLKNLNAQQDLFLTGFLTFENDLNCISSLQHTEVNDTSRFVFSYTSLYPNYNFQNFNEGDSLIVKVLDKKPFQHSEIFPIRDLCDELRTPAFQNPKLDYFKKNLFLTYKLNEDRKTLNQLQLGCGSQGAFYSLVNKYKIGDAARNQVLKIVSSYFIGNYLLTLVDNSESKIFKTSKLLKNVTYITIPDDGDYDLFLIQMIDDQNSVNFYFPKINMSISNNINLNLSTKNYSRLLPKF